MLGQCTVNSPGTNICPTLWIYRRSPSVLLPKIIGDYNRLGRKTCRFIYKVNVFCIFDTVRAGTYIAIQSGKLAPDWTRGGERVGTLWLTPDSEDVVSLLNKPERWIFQK